MSFLKPLDIIIYGIIGMSFLIGDTIFPFLVLPPIFFTGLFTPIIHRKKSGLILSAFMLHSSLSLIPLISFTQLLSDSTTFLLGLIEANEILYLPKLWNPVFMLSMMLLFILIIFYFGLLFGRWILKRMPTIKGEM